MKVYRNIYVKDYSFFPYQKLTGKLTMKYNGIIICGINNTPKNYDADKDFYFNCDCEYGEWKNLERVF